MMIPEVEIEALQSLSRLELEGLQMHTRYLRDYVNHNAHTLPLRYIYGVGIADGVVYVSLNEDSKGIRLSVNEQTREDIFRHINHAFVKRTGLDFLPENRPFIVYMRTHAHRLMCRIQVLRVHHIEKSIDYALLDFIGGTLRPREVELKLSSETPEDVIMLFARAAFYHTVEHLMFKFYKQPAPRYILPNLLHTDVMKTCALSVRADPRPWIAEFIKQFEKITPGTRTVHKVALAHRRRTSDAQPLNNFYPHTQCTGTDIPVPSNMALEVWRHKPYEDQGYIESPTAKRFVFENTTAKKNLETYVWTVSRARALHYTYLLHIIDT